MDSATLAEEESSNVTFKFYMHCVTFDLCQNMNFGCKPIQAMGESINSFESVTNASQQFQWQRIAD